MSKGKILIVDDDQAIRNACVRLTQREGYDVMSAGTGEEAVEILKAGHYDLVVTDLKMPGMSGMDLLKYVKINHPECDVIIMTAYPSVDSAIEALRTGVYDYIKKPFSIDELRDKVNARFEHHHPEEGSEINGVLTTYQASKFCNVSLTTVVNWQEQGLLAAYKTPGGHRRIKRHDFIEFLKKYNMPIPEELESEKVTNGQG